MPLFLLFPKYNDLLVENLFFFTILPTQVLFQALACSPVSWVQKFVSKTTVFRLPDSENHVILRLLVTTQYQCVTDRWTDG